LRTPLPDLHLNARDDEPPGDAADALRRRSITVRAHDLGRPRTALGCRRSTWRRKTPIASRRSLPVVERKTILVIVARAHQKGRSVPGGQDATSADGRRGQGMGTDTRDWPD
jgi:hypothetical protein